MNTRLTIQPLESRRLLTIAAETTSELGDAPTIADEMQVGALQAGSQQEAELDTEAVDIILAGQSTGSSAFVYDEDSPGQTPFGPIFLPNKDENTGDKKDTDETEEELTDEEVDELVNFKPPNHVRKWVEGGHTTIVFVHL